MILKQEHTSSTREQAPVGTHLARCYQLIDLGTHEEEFQGVKKRARKIRIGWELCHEHLSEGKFAGEPFHVGKTYTASLHEKSGLRKVLRSWRGRDFTEQELAGFDMRNILGAHCMICLVSNDKGYTNVDSVMKAAKGMPIPDPHNAIQYFSLDDFDPSVFDTLPGWIKEEIQKSDEWQAIQDNDDDVPAVIAPAAIRGADDLGDEIPF